MASRGRCTPAKTPPPRPTGVLLLAVAAGETAEFDNQGDDKMKMAKEILGVAIKTLALLALAALCWLALYLSPDQMSGEYDWAVAEGKAVAK